MKCSIRQEGNSGEKLKTDRRIYGEKWWRNILRWYELHEKHKKTWDIEDDKSTADKISWPCRPRNLQEDLRAGDMLASSEIVSQLNITKLKLNQGGFDWDLWT